jgi:hypothetical protein
VRLRIPTGCVAPQKGEKLACFSINHFDRKKARIMLLLHTEKQKGTNRQPKHVS